MRRHLRWLFAATLAACTLTAVPLIGAGPRAWPASAVIAFASGVVVLAIARRLFVRPIERLREALEPHASGPDVPTIELARIAASTYRAATEELIGLTKRERSREVALTHATEGVLLIDAAGDVEYANTAARGMLHERALDVTQRLSCEPLEALAARASSDGPVTEEVTLHAPAPTHVLARAVPVSGGGAVLLLTDLSESHRIDQVRRDFVANVSHELKTPAAGIRALAEVAHSALAEEDIASATGFVERMQTEAERLAKLVADLLDLSRVEADEMEIRATHLAPLVTDAVDRVRAVAETKGLDLDVQIPSLVIDADPAQLRMAIHNLVDNAVRYSEQGTVRITAEPRGDRVALTVIDRGIGIPSDDIPRIFERFYRVDKARSRERGGTGLGLSIVRHVVENHGGTVEVQSELGAGSTFTVLLPRGVDTPREVA